MSDKPKFRLIIEAADSRLPVEIRLRHLLKSLLRTWGFRCVDIVEVKDEERKESDQ